MSGRKRGPAKVEAPTDAQIAYSLPPAPPETDEDRRLNAEIIRRIEALTQIATQRNLDRAVRLAQMAARRQGPLVDFFQQLGLNYYKLADEGPQRPSFKVIEGGAA